MRRKRNLSSGRLDTLHDAKQHLLLDFEKLTPVAGQDISKNFDFERGRTEPKEANLELIRVRFADFLSEGGGCC